MAELNEDILGLSDEEFANMPIPDLPEESAEPEEKEEPAADDVDIVPDVEDAKEPDDDDTQGTEPEKEAETGDSVDADFGDDDDKEPESEKDEKEAEGEKEDKQDFDYKVAYENMMAPFKANGREVTPKSVEDAVRLMQMGANYHEKMSGMKPARKALKTLENNDLLDDEKLSFLIDLKNGNPEAITKLIKQHNIDPLDVDIKADSNYVPSNHSVSEAELQLDEVLRDIENSPSYNRTITVVTKEWDESSRTQAANQPQIISRINEHVESGVYDTVMNAVRYERSLGNLRGVSDFEAYKSVGTKMDAEGALNGPANSESQKTETSVPKAQPKDPAKELARKAKKKAASSTKSKGKVAKLPANFNPLNMTDEEFEKFDPKLLGIK